MVLTESKTELNHGDKAPSFTLKGTDGKSYSLEDFKGKKAYLIVFICNHCPYVLPKIAELVRIQKDFPEIQVICINSNNNPDFPEDSFENMQKFVQERGINFPYLFDDTQDVAKKYGAVCTPDPFLFDSDKKLIFVSRINEGGMQEGSQQEMHLAITEFLETGKITIPETPSMGCSIKWKY